VKAANYEAWSPANANYDFVRSLHEGRYRTSDSFTLLIEELEAQRTARAESSITLLEKARQAELAERKEGREEREELVRRAFGRANSSANDDEDAIGDIILEEAAYVLNDIIDHPPTSKQ